MLDSSKEKKTKLKVLWLLKVTCFITLLLKALQDFKGILEENTKPLQFRQAPSVAVYLRHNHNLRLK